MNLIICIFWSNIKFIFSVSLLTRDIPSDCGEFLCNNFSLLLANCKGVLPLLSRVVTAVPALKMKYRMHVYQGKGYKNLKCAQANLYTFTKAHILWKYTVYTLFPLAWESQRGKYTYSKKNIYKGRVLKDKYRFQ